MSDQIFCYLAGAAALKFTLAYAWLDKISKNAVKVGNVSQINLFPLKSGKALALDKAVCNYDGLGHGSLRDRRWLVTNGGERYHFLTGRNAPGLLQVQLSLHGNNVHLDAPNMDTLVFPLEPDTAKARVCDTEVWDQSISAYDCGNEASVWMDKYLSETGCHILYHKEPLPKRTTSSMPSPYHKYVKPDDKNVFQDEGPFLLTSESSLRDLNSKVTSAIPISMAQFRPNIVVATDEKPFDEDNWKEIYIGKAKFTNFVPADRCNLTTINPETLARDPKQEPLTTLKTYRLIRRERPNNPCFGALMVADRPGEISVGDEVYALRQPWQPL